VLPEAPLAAEGTELPEARPPLVVPVVVLGVRCGPMSVRPVSTVDLIAPVLRARLLGVAVSPVGGGGRGEEGQ
jgi:hypothetical protein